MSRWPGHGPTPRTAAETFVMKDVNPSAETPGPEPRPAASIGNRERQRRRTARPGPTRRPGWRKRWRRSSLPAKLAHHGHLAHDAEPHERPMTEPQPPSPLHYRAWPGPPGSGSSVRAAARVHPEPKLLGSLRRTAGRHRSGDGRRRPPATASQATIGADLWRAAELVSETIETVMTDQVEGEIDLGRRRRPPVVIGYSMGGRTALHLGVAPPIKRLARSSSSARRPASSTRPTGPPAGRPTRPWPGALNVNRWTSSSTGG